MNRISEQQVQAKTVIQVACRMLERQRRMPPMFAQGAPNLGDDCHVLLEDATRSFCEDVREARREPGAGDWPAIVSRMLLEHPEHCEAILSLLESGQLFPNSDLVEAPA
jgi:hypothetical protein